MANKTINVQYKLRGDTLANLEAKNAVYGMNEPIVVLVPADTDAGTKAVTLLKLGDGTTAFNDLPYVTALAGDVPAWAKATTKPEYAANEIKNLDAYISGKVQDTDTQYKLEQDATDSHILILYAKALGDADYTEIVRITTADTVYDDTALNNRVKANEDAISVLNSDENTDGSIAKKIADAQKAADQTVNDTIGTLPEGKTVIELIEQAKNDATYDDTELVGKINSLIGDDANKSARTIANEELAKQLIPEGAKESLDTLTEIAAWIQAHPDDAAAINKAIADLTALVGILPEDATSSTVAAYIKEYADAAISALKIGDYAKVVDLTAAVTRITNLETAIENKVDKVTGKDLSSNDFSDEHKAKLDGIAEGATKVEASTTNGNVKIGGTETIVYTLPDSVVHDTDTIILNGGNA